MSTTSLYGSPTTGGAPIADALPLRAGIGLKPEHFESILESLPEIGFFEIHAENYLVDGGPFHHYLARIRERYPLSIHGVGMNIGGESPLDHDHLGRVARLLERYRPAIFSEHLAWTAHGGRFLNDLLPLPYTPASQQRVCDHVDQIQTRLGRRMLLENPATYVQFSSSSLAETDFIAEVVARSGCGLLLDVNNVHVSCINHGLDPHAYLRALPTDAVGEIHLAGFARERDADGATLLIDSHDAPVDEAVWALYEDALSLCGPAPTLIERDGNIPPLDVLLAEAARAERQLLARPRPEARA